MGEEPTQAKPKEKAKSKKTSYVVLRHDGAKWDSIHTVAAHSSESAIRATAEARSETSHPDGGDGTYVAVPESMWKPLAIEIELAKPKAVVKRAPA